MTSNPGSRPSRPLRLFHALRRGLGTVLGWLIALLVLFEEWGWEPLRRALQRLSRWSLIQRVEERLTRLPPAAALVTLLLPGLLLLPVKLTALWLIGTGHPMLGLGVIILAKLVGTALVAHIFALTQPSLMRMGWFAHLYERWHAWKTLWLERVRASIAWQRSRQLKAAAKSAFLHRIAPRLLALRTRVQTWFRG